MLFVPANNEELLDKAADTAADAIIFDLEDAVRTFEDKRRARQLVRERLELGDFADETVYCRVNDYDSGELFADLTAVTRADLDGIVYPKVTDDIDVRFLDEFLTIVEQHRDIAAGSFDIVPLVETPSAVLNVAEIAAASNRVVAITFGSEDFVAGLRGGPSSVSDVLHVPRALIAMGARAADVVPIDTVYIDVKNTGGFRDFTETADRLGFEGSLVLHPDQVEVANEQYSPSEEEIEEATEILRIADNMESKAVDQRDGTFVGPPLIRSARQTLKRHAKIENDE